MRTRRLFVAALALLACLPARALLPEESRRAITAYCDRAVAEKLAPGGSLLVVAGDQVEINHGFGFADIEAGRRFGTDEPVRVASISKSLCAAVLLRLHVAGAMDLDVPIDRWLPEFRGVKLADGTACDRAPTLREILNHYGGFASDDEGGRPWQKLEYRRRSLDDVVAEWAAQGLRRRPGTEYAYSGIGYSVAALAAERALGKPFEELLQSELCRPLGMADTSFFPDEATWARVPRMYRRTAVGWEAVRTRPNPVPGQYFSHAGEVISTAADLVRFLQMIRHGGLHDGERFLPAEAVAQWLTIPPPDRRRYSLGLNLGGPYTDGLAESLWHTGSSGTLFWWDRDHDVIGVVLTQTADPTDDNLVQAPEFIWLVDYRVEGACNAADARDRLRVGIYRGPGSSSATVGALAEVLRDPAAVLPEVVTPDRVRDGELAGLDVVVFPGGSGSAQSEGLGEAGREAVRGFVRGGGGFLGICAGAYLACDGFSWGLHILDARTVSNKWQRGVGTVRIELTGDGRELLASGEAAHTIHYANGPILAPNDNPDLPDFAPLAFFRTELAENGTPVGAMVDTPAMVSATFGAGRVLAFSPHAEKTDGLHGWIRRAIEWAAGD